MTPFMYNMTFTNIHIFSKGPVLTWVGADGKIFNAFNHSYKRAIDISKVFAFVNYQNVLQRLEIVDDSKQIRAL